MQAKRKICAGCSTEQYIWGNIAGKKYCQKCYHNRKSPIIKVKVPRTRINPFSAAKIEQLKEYRKRRDRYFKEHPICEFPGCTSRDIDLHHKKGRVGNFLTDKRYFCSLCRVHHVWVENNPKQAIQMGLSIKRLEV